ncbi:AMP-binding protein [Nonomuraea salmonea]|uniref:AMP-binding protein n=1 Tax=Nonomuraea salmonea TaxID=46181 RepID=UPI002FE7B997
MGSWETLPRMLRDQAERHPDDVVVAEPGGPRLTLARLRAAASEVARGLLALGVAPGDRVALWGVNSASWVVHAFGIWDAGAVIVPLSPRYKGIEAGELIAKTGAEVVIAGPGASPELLPETRVVPMGGLAARVPAREAEERALAVRDSDLCEIMATSGTTGTPKGVMLDHAQILRGYLDWSEIVTLGPHDRYPVIAPPSAMVSG